MKRARDVCPDYGRKVLYGRETKQKVNRFLKKTDITTRLFLYHRRQIPHFVAKIKLTHKAVLLILPSIKDNVLSKKMMKKSGFDATSITKNHNGGKNQVPLNLLRGFEKNGVADSFVIFCLPEMEKDLSILIPHAILVSIESRKLLKNAITEIWIRTFILPGYLKKYQIGALLFPTFNTGIRRYPIPTVVIPHDIQTQTHKERFSLKTRLLMGFYYHFDFKLRNLIVAISNFDKQEIAAAYPAYQEKIVQIYNRHRTAFQL